MYDKKNVDGHFELTFESMSSILRMIFLFTIQLIDVSAQSLSTYRRMM